MKDEETLKIPVESALWVVSCKLQGLGYLIAHQKNDLLGDDSEYARYGVGEIIRELGTELLDLKEALECGSGSSFNT